MFFCNKAQCIKLCRLICNCERFVHCKNACKNAWKTCVLQ
nr:MAG TPA: hypothetical protein [Bacteriophage sp.]